MLLLMVMMMTLLTIGVPISLALTLSCSLHSVPPDLCLMLVCVQMSVASKLGPQASPSCLARVGVSRLRRFLERRVEECYRKNVARIVPLLQHEMSKAENRLLNTEQEVRPPLGKPTRVSTSATLYYLHLHPHSSPPGN